MGKLVSKIVLTGGPCAGKTTALSRIEQELSDLGFRVFIIGESATELIKGGIRPFGKNAFHMVDFQRFILKYQYQKEQLYQQAISSLPEEEKCIIVCDRGLMDNKAYIPDATFHELCHELGVGELNILDSYDMVLHLVTAADGCSEYYTLANNEARSESIDEAICLDKKTQQAWSGHNRFVIIDNSSNFEDKINRVLENIYQLVHHPYALRYQKKYLIHLDEAFFQSFPAEEMIQIDMDQTYLESPEENIEKRLRKRTLGEEETFYLTIQRKVNYGLNEILTDKRITKREYYEFMDSPKKGNIKKKRYTFIFEKQYFKLDVIEGKNFALLEVNPTAENSKIVLPNWLSIEREVTGDVHFHNSTLASEKNKVYTFHR